MSRACVVAACTKKGRKSTCCGQTLCEDHAKSVFSHACPRSAELLSMTKKQAKAFLAQEKDLRTQVILTANDHQQLRVHLFKFDTGHDLRGGRMAERGAGDIIGYAQEDGLFIAMETKNSHSDHCSCAPCEEQRKWGRAVEIAGGVYVGNVRDLQSALYGLRLGLARARGRPS